jgi:putative endonuclease
VTQPDRRKETGMAGESAVAAYLEARGFVVEARNWRCRTGELDLVVTEGDLIAFVEVRSATTDYLTSPAITVTFGKQRRVSRAADAYLQARGHCPERIRFDVAGVSWRDGEAEIAYFENAFVPTSAY